MCINTKYSILSSIFNVYFIGLNVECLINEVYKRVETIDESNKEEGLVNCNMIDQVIKNLEDEFLVPILGYKDQIIESGYGNPFVVIIHGMGEGNRKTYIESHKEDVNTTIFIGYGQARKGDERHTAPKSLVSSLIGYLREDDKHPTKAAETDEEWEDYRGWDKNNLNQLFRDGAYKDKRVQSIQLEITKMLRDNANIYKTVDILGEASVELVKPIPLALVEDQSDTDLVDKAYHKLFEIFSKHYENAMREAGKYILDEFYDGDIEKARKKEPIKGKSFFKLISKLHPKESGGPSKSWVYNAINLVVESHDFRNFHTYGKLQVSKKVLLLPLDDREQKEQLIKEIAESGLTAKNVRERVAALKEINDDGPADTKDLPQVIQKPQMLFSDDYSPVLSLDSLIKYHMPTLNRMQTQIRQKMDEIEKEKDRLSSYLKSYEKLAKRIDAVKGKKSKEKSTKIQAAREVRSPNKRNRYVLMSVLQKAIRWCEVNDARYFAQEFIEMGKPGTNFNRLMIIAAEDIGLADPTLVKYVGDCVDTFEAMRKEYNTTRTKVSDFPEIRAVIDRAVIAAALSFKSRLLPMLSFATLFDIYKKEDFSHDLGEYENRFRTAIQRQDEKEAAYYAYILGLFLDSEESVFKITQQESERRNTILIHEWTREYEAKKNYGPRPIREAKKRLMLAGIISLLCRDLDYDHGEYQNLVSDYLSLPIEKATIPDRAYDMHTGAGTKKGRGLEHFFNEGGSVKNERFPSNWEEAGSKAYFQAEKEGLQKSDKLIEAIKEKL